jgi:hypothetical protein
MGSPLSLTDAHVGRHPDHTMAHSSTAKAVVFCCRDKDGKNFSISDTKMSFSFVNT